MKFLTCWSHLFASLLAVQIPLTQAFTLSAQTVFQFTPPVSVENIVERPNGNILATVQGAGEVWEINPRANQSGQVIAQLGDLTNAFSGVQLEPDLFYMLAVNYTETPSFSGVVGSDTLFELDFRGCDDSGTQQPTVTKVFSIDGAYTLDGMALVNADKGLLIAGDTQEGTLWTLNVKNRTYFQSYSSPLLNQTVNNPPTSFDHTGINGVKYNGSHIYWTTTAQRSFGSVPVDPNTGMVTGEATVITYFTGHPDDFIISTSNIALNCLLDQGLVATDLNQPAKTPVPLLNRLGMNSITWGIRSDDRCILYGTYNLEALGGNASALLVMNAQGSGLAVGC